MWGLSNTAFDATGKEEEWAKISIGKKLFREAIDSSVSDKSTEEDLISNLLDVLSHDTLPRNENASLVEYISELKKSIFIPMIGDEKHRKAMEAAMAKGPGVWATDDQKAAEELMSEGRPDPSITPIMGFETGMYGTQRQTVVLVDWEGKVTMVERALWDGNGNAVPKGRET
ncbi:hypothetical protein NXS19_004955 [Fusarium pseudograminearum]|nr:hypothetical protein NXS19_004955 [Fusarium pseudograminearum]